MLKLFEDSLRLQDYLVLGAILIVLIIVIIYLVKNRCNSSCDCCTKQGCKKRRK